MGDKGSHLTLEERGNEIDDDGRQTLTIAATPAPSIPIFYHDTLHTCTAKHSSIPHVTISARKSKQVITRAFRLSKDRS